MTTRKGGAPRTQGYFLEQRASGRWRGGVRTPSGKKITRTFDYEYEAEAFAIATRDRLAQAAETALGSTTGVPASPSANGTEIASNGVLAAPSASPSLAEFGGLWLRVNRTGWTAPTYDGYEIQFRKGIRESAIAEIPIAALTREDVLVWRASMLDDGVGVPTINRRVKVLRIILNYGIATDRLGRNVATGIKDLAVETVERPRTLSPVEVDRLLDQCRTPEQRAQVLLGVDAGLRWGEMAGLSVDAVRGDFVVVKQVVERKTRTIRKFPKSKHSRTVPMTDRLREALAVVALFAQVRGDDALLFVTLDDGVARPLCARNWLRDFWHGATHRAGLNKPGNRFGFHGLRHTYGTNLAGSNVPTREIAELMGHASTSTTEIYLHAGSDERRLAIVRAALG
jgi:integrase